MIVIGAEVHNSTHALGAVDAGAGRVRGQRRIKSEQAEQLAAVPCARLVDDERLFISSRPGSQRLPRLTASDRQRSRRAAVMSHRVKRAERQSAGPSCSRTGTLNDLAATTASPARSRERMLVL
jgi:hypothetical protein